MFDKPFSFDFFKNDAKNSSETIIQEGSPTEGINGDSGDTIADINDFFTGGNVNKLGTNMSEVTYFTCLKILTESLGKLNLKLYQDDPEKGKIKVYNNQIYSVLRTRPNPYMTPSIFWGTIELFRNQYGNGYAYMQMVNGKLIGLWIMHPRDVRVLFDNAGVFGKENAVYYKYSDPQSKAEYLFDEKEVIHVKSSITENGLVGKSNGEMLASTLQGSKASQEYLNNLYENGLTAKAVIEYTGDLNDAKKTKMVQRIQRFSSGAGNAGGILPLPIGMKLTPLNITLADSQFFELKKYNGLQIAASFGIKPNYLNNYEKSSYANSEAQTLSFYTDTMLYILTQYEQEIAYKFLTEDELLRGYFYKFNEKGMLRSDSKTQMENISTAVTHGIYTSEEARDELDKPYVPHRGKLLVNGTYIPIEDAGKQYEKGGEKNAKT